MVTIDTRPLPIRYLAWHYGAGFAGLKTIITNFLLCFYHMFSIPVLLRTLFAPWKRAVRSKHRPGVSLDELGERVSFNLISRLIGAVVRIATVSAGLLLLVVTAIAGGGCLLLWVLTPGLSLPFYLADTDTRELRRVIRHPDVHTMLTTLADTHFGLFLLSRLGISRTAFLSATDKEMELHIPADLLRREHRLSALFLLMYNRSTQLQRFFDQQGISADDIHQICSWYDRLSDLYAYEHRFWDRNRLLRLPAIGKTWVYGYTPTLDNVTKDLTNEPIPNESYRARKREIAVIDQILSKRTVNSVLLVGDSGVGKHPLAVYIAHETAAGRVLPELEGKRFLYLEMERLFGGAPDQTTQKALLSAVLSEAAGAGNIVLVIDEFDRFVSSGPDRIDFSDVVAHNLAAGTLRIIALCTPESYHQFIQPNAGLHELFEVVRVESLSAAETLPVLLDQLPALEHTGVWCRYQSVKEVIHIADRYVHDAPFPEKGLVLLDDLLTTAAAAGTGRVLDVSDIQHLASARLGIPLTLDHAERDILLQLETTLHERVVGQDGAITAIAQALRRARADISESATRPIGSFLFLGPTGVGKTETAKTLAATYFKNETALQRFDMAQYHQADAWKQLLGDFESGKVGIFSERLQDHPACVVLLDEFEKADAKLRDIFLTALDEGYITDAFGKKVYLNNTIIIATSNAGSEFIREQVAAGTGATQLTTAVIERVQRDGIFSPELLNRFDAISVFQPLTDAHTEQILARMLARFNEEIHKRHGATVTLTQQTRATVLKQGFDAEYGGRALRRAFQQYVENPLAERVLRGEVHRGTEIAV